MAIWVTQDQEDEEILEIEEKEEDSDASITPNTMALDNKPKAEVEEQVGGDKEDLSSNEFSDMDEF